MTTKIKKQKPHYVDNEKFLKAMDEYKQLLNEAEESGEEKPVVPNYIGECIMKIATKLSYSPNFINYSYREDMVLDGIENCIRYIHNFDSEKSKNPFSYFTQIIYYAFLRRIKKEKDQSSIRGKLIMEMPYEVFDLQGHDEEGHFTNSYIEFMQIYSNLDSKAADDSKKKDKKKKSTHSLDNFLEDID